MKRIVLMLFITFSLQISAQDIFGEWKVIDKNGISKCIVSIYKKNNKVFGKIVKILVSENKNALCEKCEGDQKNKPILGLVILKDLEKQGKYYKNGTIFDPEHGDTFKCRLTLEDKNTLQVRGYLSFIYSTQYWERASS